MQSTRSRATRQPAYAGGHARGRPRCRRAACTRRVHVLARGGTAAHGTWPSIAVNGHPCRFACAFALQKPRFARKPASDREADTARGAPAMWRNALRDSGSDGEPRSAMFDHDTCRKPAQMLAQLPRRPPRRRRLAQPSQPGARSWRSAGRGVPNTCSMNALPRPQGLTASGQPSAGGGAASALLLQEEF